MGGIYCKVSNQLRLTLNIKKDALRASFISRAMTCQPGRSSLNMRQPLIMVLIRLCRDMMSSRTAA